MAKGQIQCCGSSLFLKRLYGVGYSFTISVSHDEAAQNAQGPIHEVVVGHVADGQLVSAHGAELIYRLPFASSGGFPKMLRAIDAQKDRLNVDSYGISVTTLEEVFIAVGHGNEPRATRDLVPDVIDFKKRLDTRKRSLVEEHDFDDIKIEHHHQGSADEQRAFIIERRWTELLGEIRDRSQKNLFGVHLKAIFFKKYNYPLGK